jgi:hypothetical protein
VTLDNRDFAYVCSRAFGAHVLTSADSDALVTTFKRSLYGVSS